MRQPAILSTAQWKSCIEQGETPEHACLRKGYVAEEVKVIESERQIRFVISTEDVDRDRDTIAVDGWDLADYRRNSVVLWSHNYSQPPIGKSVEIAIADNKLKSLTQFPTREMYQFADTVYRLIKGGYLNATSVGFRPIEWVMNEERMGVDFKKQSLMEFSVVPIPSNPHCLVDAKSHGTIDDDDAKLYLGWAEQVLDEWHGEKGLWLPKSKVEAAFAALNTTTHIDMGREQDSSETPVDKSVPAPDAETLTDLTTTPSAEDPPLPTDLLTGLRDALKEASDTDLADLKEVCDLLLAKRHPQECEGEVYSLDDFLASAVADDYHHQPVDDLAHLDPNELRQLLAPVLGELVSEALGKQVTAITGRLVD